MTLRTASTFLLCGAFLLSGVGCFPVYPPGGPYGGYDGGAKDGLAGPQEPYYPPATQPVGVDPALVVAGAAAAGLLGYAIASNHGHHHHHYHGPAYYRPAYRGGYYGPRYYR